MLKIVFFDVSFLFILGSRSTEPLLDGDKLLNFGFPKWEGFSPLGDVWPVLILDCSVFFWPFELFIFSKDLALKINWLPLTVVIFEGENCKISGSLPP